MLHCLSPYMSTMYNSVWGGGQGQAGTGSASLMVSPTDLPSFLANHQGLPSEPLQSPLHIINTHVPLKGTQVFSLCNTESFWNERLLGFAEV